MKPNVYSLQVGRKNKDIYNGYNHLKIKFFHTKFMYQYLKGSISSLYKFTYSMWKKSIIVNNIIMIPWNILKDIKLERQYLKSKLYNDTYSLPIEKLDDIHTSQRIPDILGYRNVIDVLVLSGLPNINLYVNPYSLLSNDIKISNLYTISKLLNRSAISLRYSFNKITANRYIDLDKLLIDSTHYSVIEQCNIAEEIIRGHIGKTKPLTSFYGYSIYNFKQQILNDINKHLWDFEELHSRGDMFIALRNRKT